MATFGEKLRQERKSRGISLKEIANATKIARHHLDALERNDLRALPGGTFNKGYVRQYAKYLDLDEDAVVEAYMIEEKAQGIEAPGDEAIAEEVARAVNARGAADGKGSRAFPVPRAALIASLVVAVAAVGWLVLRPGPGTPAGGAAPSSSQDVTSPPSASASSQAARPEAGMGALPAAGGSGSGGSSSAGSDRRGGSSEEPGLPAAGDPGSSPMTTAEPSTRQATAGAPAEIAASTPPTRNATPGPAESNPAGEPAPEPDRASAEPKPARTGPASTQAAPAGASASGMSISASGVGTDVVDRQLVGESEEFPVGTRVHFWNRVTGGRDGDVLRHVWIRDGKPVETIELSIGGPSWRTYSLKTMFAGGVGDWTVEARAPDGTVLARQAFRCTP